MTIPIPGSNKNILINEESPSWLTFLPIDGYTSNEPTMEEKRPEDFELTDLSNKIVEWHEIEYKNDLEKIEIIFQVTKADEMNANIT